MAENNKLSGSAMARVGKVNAIAYKAKIDLNFLSDIEKEVKSSYDIKDGRDLQQKAGMLPLAKNTSEGDWAEYCCRVVAALGLEYSHLKNGE